MGRPRIPGKNISLWSYADAQEYYARYGLRIGSRSGTRSDQILEAAHECREAGLAFALSDISALLYGEELGARSQFLTIQKRVITTLARIFEEEAIIAAPLALPVTQFLRFHVGSYDGNLPTILGYSLRGSLLLKTSKPLFPINHSWYDWEDNVRIPEVVTEEVQQFLSYHRNIAIADAEVRAYGTASKEDLILGTITPLFEDIFNVPMRNGQPDKHYLVRKRSSKAIASYLRLVRDRESFKKAHSE